MEGCDKKYTEKSSAIRHLNTHHKDVYDTIKSDKSSKIDAKETNSQFSFEIRCKVNPVEVMNACADLITIHGLPLAAIEYPAFKKLLHPYIEGLKTKGVELIINNRTIKAHIEKRTNELREIIKKETKRKMVSIMIDIASRYNRSVLGVTLSYMHAGKICVRTIAVKVLKASHTGMYIMEVLREILSNYGIRLEQIVSITSDNGKNVIKAIALLDAYYQNSANRPEANDDEDEFYIDTDIFDEDYYGDLLKEVETIFEGACTHKIDWIKFIPNVDK